MPCNKSIGRRKKYKAASAGCRNVSGIFVSANRNRENMLDRKSFYCYI